MSWKLASKLAISQHFVTVPRHLPVTTQPALTHLHTAGTYSLGHLPPARGPKLANGGNADMKPVSQRWGCVPGCTPREAPGCTLCSLYWPTRRKNTARLWPRRRGCCPLPPSKSLCRCFSPEHPQSAMRVQCATWVWKAAAMTGQHGASRTQPQRDRALGYLKPVVLVLAR